MQREELQQCLPHQGRVTPQAHKGRLGVERVVLGAYRVVLGI